MQLPAHGFQAELFARLAGDLLAAPLATSDDPPSRHAVWSAPPGALDRTGTPAREPRAIKSFSCLTRPTPGRCVYAGRGRGRR